MTEKFDFEKYWLNKFSNCLEEVAGEEVREDVMTGSEKLSDASSREEVINWSNQAMERLSSLVNEEKQIDIMTGCACNYSKSQLQEIREKYEQTKDINVAHRMLHQQFESLLKDTLKLNEDLIKKIIKKGWSTAGVKEGNVILATKIPKSAYIKQYFETTDPEEKRAIYCHCPRVRDALKSSIEDLPEIYCYCGAGFFKIIWEEILEKSVKVKVLESVMKGDEVCKIAIYLPPDA